MTAVLAGVFCVAALPLAGSLAASGVAVSHLNTARVSTITPYFDGYYTTDAPLPLGYISLAEGRYRLGYTLDVRAVASTPDTDLKCGFVDANGIIGYLAGEIQRVPANGAHYRVTYTRVFPVPEVTVALRCRPTRAGHLTVDFRNTTVSVIPLQQ